MTEEAVLFEPLGAVARLTLNRPKAMNAMNLATLALLDQHLQAIEADDAVRVLVITGSGPAFCAGADLKQVVDGLLQPAGEADFLDLARDTLNRLRNFPKPVIVALNGVTMAGGLEITLCADIVLAADSATIADAHANFGVFPGAGGAAVLPRVLPHNVAMYLLLTGKSMTAAEAKTFGLVNEVHPAAELADAALLLAHHIAKKSPIALRRMKEVARASADKTQADALLHEQFAMRQHLRTLDFTEGLKAFAEKRAPLFQGR